MTIQEKVALWDAINQYVVSCGGDPSTHVYGNTTRMRAVVTVESIVGGIASAAEYEEREACAQAADEEIEFCDRVLTLPADKLRLHGFQCRKSAAKGIADAIRARGTK
jgi:hypothetical protein